MKIIHKDESIEILVENKLYFFERFHAKSGMLFEHKGGYMFISKIEMDENRSLVNAVAIDKDGNKSFSCKFIDNSILKNKCKTYSEITFILNTMSANKFQQILNLQLSTCMWTENIPDSKMNLYMRRHIIEKYEEAFVSRHTDEKTFELEETGWFDCLFGALISVN